MKYYDGVRQIDNLLAKRITKKATARLLAVINEDTAYENYFLSKVKDIKWFDVLHKHGYFNAEKAPGPKPVDKEGYFTIPEWTVLSYLERVSEQVNISGNEKYINELLQFIKDVSNYKSANGQHIDNYRTWWYFVKIIINIPREKMPIDIIELIPIWLNSKFNIDVVGADIGIKLLPKFLSGVPSAEDITKAERIIDFITLVKSVKLDEGRAKLYGKEEEYKLIIDPYWVKEVFEKHGKDIGEKCSDSVVHMLSNKIRALLRKNESLIPLEVGDKAYLLALSSADDKYLVKVFDMGEKSESGVYEYVLMKKEIKGAPLKELSIDETTLENFMSTVFDDLTKEESFKCSDTKKLKRDIHNLYRNFYDEETYTSFYDESRTHSTDPLEILTFVLKNILMARSKKHIDETKEILTRFFDEKYLYFPKMALYIIGNNINEYSEIFLEALEKDVSNLIFGEIYFGDELKHVLENLPNLSAAQIEKLKAKIERGPGFVPDENPDKYVAQWKQEICHALIKNPDFKKIYELLKAQTGRDASLHAAVGEIKTRWGEGPSPLTKEEILQMLSTNKLPSYLKDFKSTGFWEEGPTVGGLAKLIKECVAEQPNKFIDNLSPFINTGFIYIYEMLDGARDAWNKKQDIAWGKLFEFMHLYINRDEFWKDEFIVAKEDFLGGANHFWIIGATMQLIQDGTRNDSWAYGEEHFDISEKIIFLILSKLETEEDKEITDYVTHALNSPHGKTLIALINHALRIARVRDKKGNISAVRWSDEIKGKYNEMLEKKIIESFALLGRYLPNLLYLDKPWAEEKVKSLYPGPADEYWAAFMNGYLSIGRVYDDLYNLMSLHYKRGITYEFKNKHDNEHLIQHIAFGYLLGKEDINNPESLFSKVLEAWNRGKILDVINFFWANQKYIGDEKEESQKIIEKIIYCWKWIYDNKYKSKQMGDISTDDKKILSVMGKLTIFIPLINEEYSQWLLLVAPYTNENYNSSFFVEYLNKFDDPQSSVYLGKIFSKILEHYIPYFREENIQSIVEKLYKHGQKDDADKICNIYGMNRYEFLRDLYEKYNRSE